MARLTDDRLVELYRGVLDQVADHGYDRLTMDHVAAATRSSKATLYRQWGSKTALVVEAINALAAVPEDVPDTGTFRGDLFAMVEGRSRSIEAEAELVGAILHAVKSEPELRDAVRDQVLTVLRARMATVVARAVAREEIAADAAALPHLDLLVITPFVLRIVLDDTPVDEAYLTDYLDAVVLPALTHLPALPA